MIELRALGTAEIQTGLATLTPSQEIVFAAALYLIIERGRSPSRSKVASLLWPRAAERTRAHRLRQTILQLKKLGIVIHADRTKLCLPEDTAWCDFDEISANATAVLDERFVEFLPGYSPRCSDAFRDWVDSKRGEVHTLISRRLVGELNRDRGQGNWPAVERIAAKCLMLDPYNEVAVLAQAEAAAMRGAKLQAISVLDRYIAEVGAGAPELKISASILRRRVIDRVPDRPTLTNADPAFVGREAEMEILSRGFERARGSNGSAIVVLGEPGIGKSRLSAEFGRFAELQGVRIQRATCRRTDLDRPLSLFMDIVPQLREMPGALGCSPGTLAWLKRMTEVDQRVEDSFRQIDSETLFHSIRGALFDLLDAVAEERCLVILIEDLQWLDAASSKILAQIVEWCETKPVLIIANCRPDRNFFLRYVTNLGLQTVKLEGLTPAASTALLQAIPLNRGDRLKSDIIEWCLGVSEGNPFFLQELVHQWIETGYQGSAPPSMTQVLQERLSRLSGEALQVLQTSAVLGEFATADRVKRVLEFPLYQLLCAIEELSRTAMLGAPVARDHVTGGRIQPRHDFLASSAVGRLSPLSLQALHRRSADVLEAETPDARMSTTLLWACASHRNQAGDRERALSLGLSCGQHLLEMGLAGEACLRFEESLSYCISKEDRLNLLPRYSTALQVNGEWERSKEILRECIELASRSGVRSHSQFEILLFQARNRSSFDFVTLLDDIMPCVESDSASPSHRVQAGVIALKVASDVGPSARLDAIYENIKPFLTNEDIDFVARFEADLIYHTMRTDREIGVSELEQFTRAVRSSNGDIAYLHAMQAVANACRIRGNDSACVGFLNSALDHALSHKLLTRIPSIIIAEIRLHVSAENFAAARAALSRGKQYKIPEDDEVTRAEWQYFEARVALEDSDLADLENAVSKIEIVPQTYSIGRRAGCLAMVLRLRLKQGQQGDSLRFVVRELENAHMAHGDIGTQDFEAYSLFLGLRAIGEEARARSILQDYVRQFRHSKRPLASGIRTLLETNFAAGTKAVPETMALV